MIDDTLKKLLDKQDLLLEEVKGAMEAIMTGGVSDIKLSSWLTALRMKGETAIEIAGCASVMQQHATCVVCQDPDAIDIVGTGGDGLHTINVSTTSAFVAAGAGITVAKHGNRAVSSKSGSADVLKSLGINIMITPEQMAECLTSVGIAFLFASSLHPAMKYAMPVRKELGIRTVFNILGPLTNPARVKRALLGVYSRELCHMLAEAVSNMGVDRFLVVHGDNGLDEISIVGKTRICDVRKGKIDEYIISPGQFGMDIASLDDIRGGDADGNADVTRGILAGRVTGPKRDIVVLNSAAGILASEKADSWHQAIQKATQAIDDGSALQKLEHLAELTQSFA